MSVNPPPATGRITSDSVTDGFDALFHSLEMIVASMTNSQPAVHAASAERQVLQDIEGKLTKLCDKSRAAIRYRYNQLTPINTLPDELLLNIFLYARFEEITREMLQFLPLTWICRRWRVLALESPFLWSLIDLSFPKDNCVLEEYLRRSKVTKLSIGQLGRRQGENHSSLPGVMGWIDHEYIPTFNVMDEEYAFFKSSIVPILHRVETLELKLSKAQWRDAFRVLQNPALSIRRCHFYESSYFIPPEYDSGTTSEYIQNAEQFLSNIFESQPLRVLDIQFMRISLTLTRLSTSPHVYDLRTLVLKNNPIELDSLFRDILRILESCSLSLEVLDLALFTPPQVRVNWQRIPMSRLSTIILHGMGDAGILEFLSTPALRALSIDGRDLPRTGSISHCMDLTSLPYMTIEDGCIIGSREPNFGLEAFRTRREGLQIMIFNFGGNPSNPRTGLKDELARWASHLQSLTVICHVSEISGLPRSILENAHAIRHVNTQIPSVDLLSLLQDRTVCPVLESLTYTSDDEKPGKQLVSLVRSRRNGPVPLKKLTLVAGEALAKTHLQKLKKLVDFTQIDAEPVYLI